MAWIFGSTTGHLAMADILFQAAKRSSLATVAVNAGGTGYVVGDVLTISGGTSIVAGQVTVTSVSGGAVTGIRISNAGIYTANPGTGAATTGGTGTGCTINTTIASNGWAPRRATNVASAVQSATVQAGGTGHAVNDVLTVSSGTASPHATFRVTSVSGGAVTGVLLLTQGDYTTVPGNPVSTTSSGAGTGCTLNLTFGSTGEREIILEGVGSGADQIFVGWRSFTDATSGARNFELAGFTGFNSALAWDLQPGVSPGRFESANDTGCYVPLTAAAINYWISVTPRRIIAWFRVGSAYPNMYLGFMNPFGTSTEYPYPLYVGGTTNDWNSLANTNQIGNSSFADPIRWIALATSTGPSIVRLPGGTWASIANSTSNGSTRSAPSGGGTYVYPAGFDGSPGYQTGDDWINLPITDVRLPAYIIPNGGLPGTQSGRLIRTVNTGGNLVQLVPCTVMNTNGSGTGAGALGELDQVFWLDAQGGVVPEDTITIAGEVYRVFQSGIRSDTWALYAVKES